MTQSNAIAKARAGRLRRNSREAVAERQQNLIFYVAMTCICYCNLMQFMGISIRGLALGRPVTLLGLACTLLLFNDKKIFKQSRNKSYPNLLLFYVVCAVLMTISSFITKDEVPVYNPVTKNLFFQLLLIQEILISIYCIAMEKTQLAFRFLFGFAMILLVVNDLLMFGGVYFTDGAFETYLVGTKFDNVYLHMTFATLFCLRLKYSRKQGKPPAIPLQLLITFFAIIAVISTRVDCNTGMLGGLLMVLMIYCADRFPDSFGKRMAKPRTFGIYLFASVTFAYYVTWILKNSLVQYIVVEKLGRSLTLTGRTMIFAMYPGAMADHWVWGYGLGNDYPVCWALFHFADAQNALLQWVLEIGIPGTLALCAIFCFCVSAYNNSAAKEKIMPLLMLEYIYVLLGTVEITINNSFILWMLFIYMLSYAEPLTINDQEVVPMYRVKKQKKHGGSQKNGGGRGED